MALERTVCAFKLKRMMEFFLHLPSSTCPPPPAPHTADSLWERQLVCRLKVEKASVTAWTLRIRAERGAEL